MDTHIFSSKLFRVLAFDGLGSTGPPVLGDYSNGTENTWHASSSITELNQNALNCRLRCEAAESFKIKAKLA